jgi:hypothetical protein
VSAESTPAFVRIGDEGLHAYNEAAFRYFLSLERKRAAREVRQLFLMLVKLSHPTRPVGDPDPFATIFSVLNACVREIDLVGWYREGVVAAALFAGNAPTIGRVRENVSARVLDGFRETLPERVAARLRTRIVSLHHTTNR